MQAFSSWVEEGIFVTSQVGIWDSRGGEPPWRRGLLSTAEPVLVSICRDLCTGPNAKD